MYIILFQVERFSGAKQFCFPTPSNFRVQSRASKACRNSQDKLNEPCPGNFAPLLQRPQHPSQNSSELNISSCVHANRTLCYSTFCLHSTVPLPTHSLIPRTQLKFLLDSCQILLGGLPHLGRYWQKDWPGVNAPSPPSFLYRLQKRRQEERKKPFGQYGGCCCCRKKKGGLYSVVWCAPHPLSCDGLQTKDKERECRVETILEWREHQEYNARLQHYRMYLFC
ncbi:hypothetical protein CDAR_526871 [Caerostris darwini]|uniref:Uncharacterized protein n=1 Tax=Caerostris darwini TaxID=1538125 RepID=A0AAV4Q5Q9_9ARAC|nr:hypothetical protein CDAR_526871 [Caerostris darwini]